MYRFLIGVGSVIRNLSITIHFIAYWFSFVWLMRYLVTFDIAGIPLFGTSVAADDFGIWATVGAGNLTDVPSFEAKVTINTESIAVLAAQVRWITTRRITALTRCNSIWWVTGVGVDTVEITNFLGIFEILALLLFLWWLGLLSSGEHTSGGWCCCWYIGCCSGIINIVIDSIVVTELLLVLVFLLVLVLFTLVFVFAFIFVFLIFFVLKRLKYLSVTNL